MRLQIHITHAFEETLPMFIPVSKSVGVGIAGREGPSLLDHLPLQRCGKYGKIIEKYSSRTGRIGQKRALGIAADSPRKNPQHPRHPATYCFRSRGPIQTPQPLVQLRDTIAIVIAEKEFVRSFTSEDDFDVLLRQF